MTGRPKKNWCRWCGADLPSGAQAYCMEGSCVDEALEDARRRKARGAKDRERLISLRSKRETRRA